MERMLLHAFAVAPTRGGLCPIDPFETHEQHSSDFEADQAMHFKHLSKLARTQFR
jgi:hypothetical protein